MTPPSRHVITELRAATRINAIRHLAVRPFHARTAG